MTTKELIKQLQDLDPEGNMVVCMPSSAIEYITIKPGFYDGPAHYIEDGKYKINSAVPNKIVIFTCDYEDRVWDGYKPDSFEFNFSCYVREEDREEYENSYKRKIQKIYEEFLEHEVEVEKKRIDDISKIIDEGYRILDAEGLPDSEMKKTIHLYFVKDDLGYKDKKVSIGYRDAIVCSERFERVKIEGGYFWQLKKS